MTSEYHKFSIKQRIGLQYLNWHIYHLIRTYDVGTVLSVYKILSEAVKLAKWPEYERKPYRIRPYYRTVRLGFPSILGKLWYNKYLPILRVSLRKKKKISERLIKWCLCNVFCFFFSDFLRWQIDAIQMGTHNICLYKEVDKKHIGCNLKTTKTLDCALRGMCGNKAGYGSTINLCI